MQITSTERSGVRIQAVTGVVTPEALVAYLKQLYTRDDFDPGQRVVWDFTQADLTRFRMPDVVTVRDCIEKDLEKPKPPRAALVVASEGDFSLTTMFKTLISSPQVTSRVFFDLDDALKWVSL